jgi:putative ABC transport system ATP-binding protein
MHEPVIQLNGVTKTYLAGKVEVPALRGIDLVVEAGECLAVMGRSGSGKSTLMNILGCLDQPSSGSYRLDGQEVNELDDDALSSFRGRTIGFVFQAFHLLRGVSVLQNVALPMDYQQVARREQHQRAADLLAKVGLGDRLLHRPNELSGGERQRVAIARALANRPRVLLADEPTGNLDSQAQARILDLFHRLHAETGVTLIMVTHDPAVARTAQRAVYISDGRVVEENHAPAG